jgi:hypothetical protein
VNDDGDNGKADSLKKHVTWSVGLICTCDLGTKRDDAAANEGYKGKHNGYVHVVSNPKREYE